MAPAPLAMSMAAVAIDKTIFIAVSWMTLKGAHGTFAALQNRDLSQCSNRRFLIPALLIRALVQNKRASRLTGRGARGVLGGHNASLE
jgi:hypothetical protein